MRSHRYAGRFKNTASSFRAGPIMGRLICLLLIFWGMASTFLWADYCPLPDYPFAALRPHLSGTVTVEIFFTPSGTVDNVVIVHSSGYTILDDHTVHFIAKNWRLSPASLAKLKKRDGKPYAVGTVGYE